MFEKFLKTGNFLDLASEIELIFKKKIGPGLITNTLALLTLPKYRDEILDIFAKYKGSKDKDAEKAKAIAEYKLNTIAKKVVSSLMSAVNEKKYQPGYQESLDEMVRLRNLTKGEKNQFYRFFSYYNQKHPIESIIQQRKQLTEKMQQQTISSPAKEKSAEPNTSKKDNMRGEYSVKYSRELHNSSEYLNKHATNKAVKYINKMLEQESETPIDEFDAPLLIVSNKDAISIIEEHYKREFIFSKKERNKGIFESGARIFPLPGNSGLYLLAAKKNKFLNTKAGHMLIRESDLNEEIISLGLTPSPYDLIDYINSGDEMSQFTYIMSEIDEERIDAISYNLQINYYRLSNKLLMHSLGEIISTVIPKLKEKNDLTKQQFEQVITALNNLTVLTSIDVEAQQALHTNLVTNFHLVFEEIRKLLHIIKPYDFEGYTNEKLSLDEQIMIFMLRSYPDGEKNLVATSREKAKFIIEECCTKDTPLVPQFAQENNSEDNNEQQYLPSVLIKNTDHEYLGTENSSVINMLYSLGIITSENFGFNRTSAINFCQKYYGKRTYFSRISPGLEPNDYFVERFYGLFHLLDKNKPLISQVKMGTSIYDYLPGIFLEEKATISEVEKLKYLENIKPEKLTMLFQQAGKNYQLNQVNNINIMASFVLLSSILGSTEERTFLNYPVKVVKVKAKPNMEDYSVNDSPLIIKVDGAKPRFYIYYIDQSGHPRLELEDDPNNMELFKKIINDSKISETPQTLTHVFEFTSDFQYNKGVSQISKIFTKKMLKENIFLQDEKNNNLFKFYITPEDALKIEAPPEFNTLFEQRNQLFKEITDKLRKMNPDISNEQTIDFVHIDGGSDCYICYDDEKAKWKITNMEHFSTSGESKRETRFIEDPALIKKLENLKKLNVKWHTFCSDEVEKSATYENMLLQEHVYSIRGVDYDDDFYLNEKKLKYVNRELSVRKKRLNDKIRQCFINSGMLNCSNEMKIDLIYIEAKEKIFKNYNLSRLVSKPMTEKDIEFFKQISYHLPAHDLAKLFENLMLITTVNDSELTEKQLKTKEQNIRTISAYMLAKIDEDIENIFIEKWPKLELEPDEKKTKIKIDDSGRPPLLHLQKSQQKKRRTSPKNDNDKGTPSIGHDV